MKGKVLHLAFIPALLVLMALAPLMSGLAVGELAHRYGCGFDEGSAHPCQIFGHEVGDTLYIFAVIPWLSVLLLPSAIVLGIIWAVGYLMISWWRK